MVYFVLIFLTVLIDFFPGKVNLGQISFSAGNFGISRQEILPGCRENESCASFRKLFFSHAKEVFKIVRKKLHLIVKHVKFTTKASPKKYWRRIVSLVY